MKYRPDVALFLGSQNAAILYQRIYDIAPLGKRPDGFVYKSAPELTTETGLSEKELRNARKLLVARGWLEIKKHRANGAPTIHYRPLMTIIDPPPKRQIRNGQRPEQKLPKGQFTNTRQPVDNTLDRANLSKKMGM